MFHPTPHYKRWLTIVVLVSCSGGFLLAQPGRIIPNQRRIIPNQRGGVIFAVPERPRGSSPSELLVPIVPPPPPMPTRVPLDPAHLDLLVSELESGDFRERVNATRELKAKGGASAVVRMLDALLSDSPEVAMRALSVLEAIFLSDDREANREAERVLRQLTIDRFDSLALQADHILDSNQSVRMKRATADLLAMGLDIDYSRDFYDVDDRTGEIYPLISNVRLSRDWKGGEEGLAQIARLDNLRLIYVIGNCPVPARRVREILDPMMPNARIEERGAVQLGIQASFAQQGLDNRGVRITQVAPGKAAHLGGIRANDLITHVEGKETPDFDALVNRLRKFEPGDVIEVIVGRDARRQDSRVLDVELKGW